MHNSHFTLALALKRGSGESTSVRGKVMRPVLNLAQWVIAVDDRLYPKFSQLNSGGRVCPQVTETAGQVWLVGPTDDFRTFLQQTA
jgi:hypothetical protein